MWLKKLILFILLALFYCIVFEQSSFAYLEKTPANNINTKDNNGDTPLHYAIKSGNIESAKHLIGKGAELSIPNNEGITPAALLLLKGNYDFLSQLKYKFTPTDIKTLVKKIMPGTNHDIAQYYSNTIVLGEKYSPMFILYRPKAAYNKDPFKYSNLLLQNMVDKFLGMADNPVIIPNVVETPALPQAVTLEKSKFESTASFRKRVEATQKQRQEEIIKLQNEYRIRVEARNKLIAEYEEIRQIRLSTLDFFKSIMMRDILNYVFSYNDNNYDFSHNYTLFRLTDPKYDPENTLMYVTLSSNITTYTKKIALRVPDGAFAESFYTNIDKISPTIKFEYDGSSIALSDVTVNWQGKDCIVDAGGGKYKEPSPMQVTVKNDVVIDPLKQKQNPNLLDNSSVNIVVYEKNKKNVINDDLEKSYSKISKAPENKKKWLFVIGAEEYDNADPVIYSENSAEMFVKAASKALGVPASNIYSFIGDKATAGAIKSGMKRLISNVAKGDTIYFYYSGHGIPVLPDKDPYILPKDIVPDFIVGENDFKLQNIYNMLSSSNADKIIAFVDSCFSGATDGESVYKGVAASRLKPKEVSFDKSKMAVITAGTNIQFSNMYEDKGHRLFSYFVIKSILNGRKDVNTLYSEVYLNVKDTSFNLGGDNRKQDPMLIGNEKLEL